MSSSSVRPVVTVQPGVNFGHPMVGGSPVETVAGRVWAGDSVDDTAEDFGLTRERVLLACWYYARWGESDRWNEWADSAEDALAARRDFRDPPKESTWTG